LPSVAAARIAVSGRQKRNRYFASKPAINASATAKLTSANVRAADQGSSPCFRTAVFAIRFHPRGESSYQNCAISDSSGVRIGLSMSPMACTYVAGVLDAGQALRPVELVVREFDHKRCQSSPAWLRGERERRRELVLPGTRPWRVDRLRGFLESVPLPACQVRPRRRLAGRDAGAPGWPVVNPGKGAGERRFHERCLVGHESHQNVTCRCGHGCFH
jgi:hypothetical protein